ncbi:MAG: cytochrome P450 [Actinobacteria bacterium]|nr:cytochrome P450 [Actinomycetota bacterium]
MAELRDTPIVLATARENLFEPPPELSALCAGGVPRRLHYADGHTGWLVTSYEQARSLVADRRFGVIMMQPLVDAETEASIEEAIGGLDGGFVSFKDPPDHTRLRRAVGDRFTPGRVAERRAGIERIVAELLDAIERSGPPADLRPDFALPIPSRVICELLGVPASDEHQFLRPTEVMLDPATTPEQASAAFRGFADYVHEVVDRKRAEPRDDLLTDMVQSGQLDDLELAGMTMELFITGHETTANAIALGVLALLRERGRWQAFGADAGNGGAWCEELLRFLSIVEQSFTRVAREDLELDGTEIRAGERVTVSLLSANHDPAAFPAPGEVSLERGARGHLAFGHGIHKCLGQHLARVEMQVALSGLAERFPALRLAAPAAKLPLGSAAEGVYRALHLPVTW